MRRPGVILLAALGALLAWLLFRQFESPEIRRARRALKNCLKRRADVLDACRHPILGRIDFRWRYHGKGLSVIQSAHPEAIAIIPTIIFSGELLATSPTNNNRVIVWRDYRLVLTKTPSRDPAHWVLTAYKKETG